MSLLILQRLLVEALSDLFYFPVWWYTGGVKYALGNFWNLLKLGNNFLAPGLWFKNLFVPMFGQYDWQGRIVSFFMRLVQVLFRSFALFLWLIFSWLLFLCWFIVPVIIFYGIFTSFK